MLPTNQNRALIIRNFFIFSDINQSESSSPSHVIFVVLSKQNEVFTEFKIIYRLEQAYDYEFSQLIILIEIFFNIINIFI